MNEKTIIRITVIMNDLKNKINPAYDNKLYQSWIKRPKIYNKIKFRDWVINSAKDRIIAELDNLEVS